MKIFNDYANLKNQIKKLSIEVKEIEERVKKEMLDSEMKMVKLENGTLSLYKRKEYEYSDEVAKLNEQLKDLKAKEESEGIARVFEIETLRYSAKENVE